MFLIAKSKQLIFNPQPLKGGYLQAKQYFPTQKSLTIKKQYFSNYRDFILK